jgi:G:T-mismatch repair DNA endonuclease (very short patch repair protein)
MKAKSSAWHTKRLAASLRTNLSGKQTKIEKKVEDFIKANNLPFKYTGNGSFSIGPLFPDFVSTDGSKVVIDVHGCYWHRCAKCFPNSKTTTLPHRQRISTYSKYGYRTIVIGEHEFSSVIWEQALLEKLS